MKNRASQLAVLFLFGAVIISGCNSTGKLTRRYKKIDYKTTKELDTMIELSGYTLEPEASEPSKPKTIFDLNEDAQAQLIKQLSSHESDNTKLITLLSSSLSSKALTSLEILDLTKFQKRIIISVKKLGHKPADRINMVDVKLSLDTSVKLLSCNRLITEYQTLEFGKQNYSNSASVGLQATAGSSASTVLTGSGSSNRTLANTDGSGFKNEGSGATGSNTFANTSVNGNTNGFTSTVGGTLGATGSFNGSRTFAEEVMLRQRIVGLQASIQNNDLNLFQNGGLGLDLSGNIIADIVFEIKDDVAVQQIISISDFSTASGEMNKPDKLKVKDFVVLYPNYKKDIQAEISFDGEYRAVMSGDQTISESDDKVVLFHKDKSVVKQEVEKSAAKNMVTIVPAKLLKPKMWTVKIPVQGKKLPLRIFNPRINATGQLIFNSVSEARNFISWLTTSFGTLTADKKIGNSGYALVLPQGALWDKKNMDELSLEIL